MPRPPQNTPTAPFPGHITLDMILKSPPKLVHHPNTPPTLNRPTSDLTCPLYYLSCVFLNPFAQPLCIVPYARHCSYSAICGPSPPSPLPLYRKKGGNPTFALLLDEQGMRGSELSCFSLKARQTCCYESNLSHPRPTSGTITFKAFTQIQPMMSTY